MNEAHNAKGIVAVWNTSMYSVGDRLGITSPYTPKFLIWRRFRRTAFRIEMAARKVARKFGKEIWTRHDFVIVNEVTSGTSFTVK